MIQLHNLSFVPFITESQIQERVQFLAEMINKDFEGKNPLFLAVLNGSFMFMADLMRLIDGIAEVSFVKVQSYQDMQSQGKVTELIGLQQDIAGRHIVIVEDIIDTGLTMQSLVRSLEKKMPSSISIATLLLKPKALQCDIKAHYIGFEIEPKFVVGYGLDYNELGRNLREIYVLE